MKPLLAPRRQLAAEVMFVELDARSLRVVKSRRDGSGFRVAAGGGRRAGGHPEQFFRPKWSAHVRVKNMHGWVLAFRLVWICLLGTLFSLLAIWLLLAFAARHILSGTSAVYLSIAWWWLLLCLGSMGAATFEATVGLGLVSCGVVC